LISIVGKREIWRTLGTDSPSIAIRRSHQVAASIERDFELARQRSGMTVDPIVLAETVQDNSAAVSVRELARAADAQILTLGTRLGR
jgi:hypothetical protein